LRAVPATLVFYESPRRLAESLAAMAETLGPRQAVVARELTKLHEEFREGTLNALAATYGTAEPPKGEVTIVVAPPPQEAGLDMARVDRLLEQALAFMPVKAAAELVSEAAGAPRRTVYERALTLKGKGASPADGEI
jgi:16S rRNA (cytidine1402-2'-O)-methyltransferase